MFKSPFLSKFLLSATILCLPLTVYSGARAAQFEQSEVNAQLFIAIARPYGDNKHDLLILQQIPGKQPCWQEQGANPTTVVPLLLNFDFTGICDRSTDSNGYSIRIDGKDLGLEYLLSIVEKEGDLWLVGTPRIDPRQPTVVIGRTHGIKNGFLKIDLEPGWRFTKRAFRGQALSHVYLTGDRTVLKPSDPNLTANPDSSGSSQPLKELTFTADSSRSNPQNPPNRSALPPLPVSPRPLSSRSPLPPLPSASNNAALAPLPVPSVNPPPTPSLAPPSSQPLPPLSPRPNPSGNGRSLPPVPVPRSVSPSASPAPLTAQSSPLPTPAQGNLSNLPPLLPPPAVNNSALPAPQSSPGSRKTLSDIMTVSPRAGATTPTTSPPNTGNLSGLARSPVPSPPRVVETSSLDRSAIANQSSYRVLVNPGNQQDQLRSRYPDAFATNYQGRSLWQIGRFSSQENAQKALSDLSSLGVQGIIVP